MGRKPAPFVVTRSLIRKGEWALYMRGKPMRRCGYFDTQGEAIDYAYRHWPWWP